jgi:hypothetical protein
MDRVVALVISFILALIGLAFLLAQPHTVGRLGIGALLLVFSAAVLLLVFRRRQAVVVQQKIEIGGAISTAVLKCRNCGAELVKENISVQDGAVFAQCPYCHTPFQLEEEPKW